MKDNIQGYHIVKKLEQTNFAYVFKAKSDEFGMCALKVAAQPNDVNNELISREFQILSQFKHPHIVSVFDYGITDDNRAYFALEFVNGKPIHKYFRGFSQDLVQCMIQVLHALSAFHAKSYVHCDLKPEHILFDNTRKHTTLIDFGFAGNVMHELQPAGTLRYMAPEAIKGVSIDQRSDLYSLGVIIYEIFSGTQLKHPYEPIKNIPDDINKVLSRLVSKEPLLRPNAPELFQSFKKHITNIEVTEPLHKVNLPETGFVEILEIAERIAQSKSEALVITGDTGTGKTRHLQELKYKYLMQGHVVLYHTAKEQTTLAQSIQNFIGLEELGLKEIEDKFQIFETINQELLTFAEHKDVAILVDGLENLSNYGLQLFRYIGYGIKDANIMLIGTAQDEQRAKDLGFEVLELRPLTKNETKTLLEKTFFAIANAKKNARDPDFAAWLHKQSGGNPLFITAILKALFEKNILIFDSNQWQVKMDALERMKVPRKMEILLRKQVRTLVGRERSILEILSIADFPLEQSIVDSILGVNTLVHLEHLKRMGFIRENVHGAKRTFSLANQLLRHAAIDNTSAAKVRRILKKIIQATEKSAPRDPHYVPFLSRLYEKTGARKKAQQSSELSALQAKSLYDYADAVTYYKKMLSYTARTDTKERARIYLEIADLNNRMGSAKAALDYYKKALTFENRELAPSIYAGMGRAYSAMCNYTKAETFFRKALSRSKKHPDREYIRTLNCLAYALLFRKRFKEAKIILKQSLSFSRQIKDAEMIAETLYYEIVHDWFQGEYMKGLRTAHKALAFMEGHGLSKQHSYTAHLISSLYQQTAKIGESHKYLETAIQELTEMKFSSELAKALVNQASLYYSQGNLEKAKDIFEKALVRAVQTENQTVRYNTLSNLGLLSEDLCQFDNAIEFHKQALAIMPDDVMPTYSLAMIFMKQGKLEESCSILKKSTRRKKASLLLIGLARVYHLRGHKESGTLLADGVRTTTAEEGNRFLNIARYLAAALAYFERGNAQQSMQYAQKLEKLAFPGSKEHTMSSALVKLNTFKLDSNCKVTTEPEKQALKSMGCLFDNAYLSRAMIESLFDAGKYITLIDEKALEELASLDEILSDLGAVTELANVRTLKEKLYPAIVSAYETSAMSQRYLDTLSKLAELISSSLGSDDFTERVLDLIIAATHAERGALFVTKDKKMALAVGRNIDHTTINDATALSRSAVAAVEHDKVIFVKDAVSNPQYSIKKSVMLHQIRSILCIPLTIADKVIGAIYLDSRINTGAFGSQDTDFLTTVAKILASIIEKSQLFEKMSEENVLLKSNIIQEIGSGYLIMIARLLHLKSKRKAQRFMTINCGTIPETLLESELFGHKKGAFTGAYTDKKGLLEEAHGGTVFLDEVTNTSVSFQAKILEAIEEKVIRRIGETMIRAIDVRFVFATNKDIEIEVEEGRFRRDLYYRINVFSIEIPPLRERRADIPLLAQFFLERYSNELNKRISGFTQDAMQQIRTCIWPGNIRELQNTIERAVVLTKNGVITPHHLGMKQVGEVQIASMSEIKKQAIIEALNATNRNIKKAAKILGVNRRTIERYVKKYNIIV